VEKGTPPPPSTDYKVVDGQVVIPSTAAERKGIQPVVHLSANGKARADVPAGRPVKFTAIIEVPQGTGKIIDARWDVEGDKTFPLVQEIKPSDVLNSGSRVTLTNTHAFSKSGTYFPTLLVTSQRDGDLNTPFARISNLDWVRVVVQ
jgi:hypothetical protein